MCVCVCVCIRVCLANFRRTLSFKRVTSWQLSYRTLINGGFLSWDERTQGHTRRWQNRNEETNALFRSLFLQNVRAGKRATIPWKPRETREDAARRLDWRVARRCDRMCNTYRLACLSPLDIFSTDIGPGGSRIIRLYRWRYNSNNETIFEIFRTLVFH